MEVRYRMLFYLLVAFDEKNTHEMIKTQVSRVLRGDNFVILDSMNFIKGYRYEMYCIARGCRSTRCVVWVDTPMSVIESFNKECDHYSHDVYGFSHLFRVDFLIWLVVLNHLLLSPDGIHLSSVFVLLETPLPLRVEMLNLRPFFWD